MTTTQVPQPEPEKALPIVEKPKLYSSGQIAVAAFFGSFLAAGFLARANLVALDKAKRANAVFAVSLVLTLALMAVALLVPKLPSPVFAITAIVVSRQAASAEFGDVADKRSSWGVAGYAAVSLAIVFAVMLAAAFVLPESVFNEQPW
jgi:hypothetical protein